MHLYLHVPFCQRRCSYCDFSIAVRKTIPAREYVAAIQSEIAQENPGSGTGDAGKSFPRYETPTIYFGGGTPSLLPPEAISSLLTSLLDAFAKRFSSTPPLDAFEVTLEANPEDVTPSAAAVWRKAGVNRISLGSQSFDDRVLKWMHRVHDASRIGLAVRTLRTAGFANISLDLIFALPAELERDWRRDLVNAIALEPEHLSLYGLTVEERTPLARWVSRGASSAPDDDRYADEYLLAHERLGLAGYGFYEVSNAARGDRISRHNSAYWTGKPYRGLGPAAHSFDGRRRFWNKRAWEDYRKAIKAGESTVESEEVLTPEQEHIERLYLGLRTIQGLPAAVVPSDRRSAWISAGWAEESDGNVRLTADGWLLLDLLVRDLTGSTAIL
ncbi:MAG TPA: radical SAM family heme chaperone HemW [Gemmatimonadales bacterium]|nr:radical SAM family heme chaperone HemW [Gemmatimonadales bacterium]